MTPRVRRYLLGILAGLALGIFTLIATSHGLRTVRGGRIGGDLPAFYGAARIVRAGDVRRLYDWETQRRAERDLLPDATEGWVPYPYPPFVAAAYVPLTLLPFKAAYLVYTLLMVCCCVAAVARLRPFLEGVEREFLLAVTATLLFYPLFRAMLGGQNTPISLLCAAATAHALARERPFQAGLWTGAWLFKPQLAVPVALLIVLAAPRRLRFVSGVALVGAFYFAVGTLMGGLGWPAWWWRDGAIPFGAAERVINRANAIAIPELAAAYHLSAMGWIAAAGVLGCVGLFIWRRRPHPVALVSIAAVTAVLIAPHALYYDGGISALALITAAASRPSLAPVAAGVWLVSWLQPFREALPAPPMTIVTAAALFLAISANARTRPSPDRDR